MMFLFDSKHLSKFFLINKSSHSTSTMVGKYYAFVTFLATNGISHFTTPPHEHQNIMGILNVVIIKLLKRVCIFSLMLPHLSYIGHMHLSLLSISLIACQLQLFTFPLHIQNSLDLNQTTPNFMSLVVCVNLGFVHTFHTNQHLAPHHVSFQNIFSCKVPTFAQIFLPPKIYSSRHVKFVENIFPFQFSSESS